jgi:phosphatidate cytidylyltransferase
VLVCSWCCDIAAYFVGGAFGRTKLAPKISPAKSVEGALAGIVAAALIGSVAALTGGHSPIRLAGLGLVIGVSTVLGDLLESFIKRQCGAKDSGVLVPGHGGVLDRMDSLLLAVAGAYFYVVATS